MTEPQTGGTYEQLLAAARLAEKEGLVSFARSDHWLWDADPPPDATDAFATVAGLARETHRIRLCVLVTPITFRHPAVIAKNAATIDQMSGGRLDLGVGTGWMESEHKGLGVPFPPRRERWERLEETLDYLDTAFAPGHGHYEGSYFSLDADVKPKPTGLRLVIGGSGPSRTPRLAGSRADEYNFFICPADEAREKIATMRKAAGGRKVEATVMGPAIVGRSDSEYQRRIGAIASRRGMTVGELEQRWSDGGVIFGTPTQAADTVASLEEAGVERIYLQWVDLTDQHGLAVMLETIRGG